MIYSPFMLPIIVFKLQPETYSRLLTRSSFLNNVKLYPFMIVVRNGIKQLKMKTIKIFALLCFISFGLTKSYAQLSVGVSVRIGPPPLPVYVQPPCPEDGYLWQPGYWAYDDMDGYYWVPGVWVSPPDPGLYWTPCYWGFDNGYYRYHAGYWGPHVGFYGGIDYGYGYPGSGFYGGNWSGRSFRYNSAVFNVNSTVVHNVYVDRTVANN